MLGSCKFILWFYVCYILPGYINLQKYNCCIYVANYSIMHGSDIHMFVIKMMNHNYLSS